MLATIISTLRMAWELLKRSRTAQLVIAVLGALALLKGAHWRGYRRGEAEAKDYIDRASTEAAEKRRQAREKVDLDARRIGSADRLRKRWARD